MAAVLSLLASTALARAQDATWIGTAGPNSWNVPSNWSPVPSGPPAYVPTGTAFFNSSLSPSTTVDIGGSTTIGGLTFTSAPAYTFTVPGTLVINGAGVSVDAGSATPTFSLTGGGSLVLLNSATLGRSNVNIDGASGLSVLQTSSAGSGIITNAGTINFNDGSNGGTATIFNNAGAHINFNQPGGPLSASAGSATIDNSGTVIFFNASTAGNATLITRSGGSMLFINQSSAGASQQTIMAGGSVTFQDFANAGASTITNNSNASGLQFNGAASAGSANITNNASAFMSFGASGSGSASAGNATINNLGTLVFESSSTASNATITTGPGGTTIFTGGSTGGTSHLVINSTGLGLGSVQINTLAVPTFTIGSLAGTGANAQFTIGSKTLIVGDSTSTIYQGVLFDSGSGGSLTKVGTGTLTIANVASYNGATTILNGDLNITGQLQQTSSILVGTAGTLSGNGTVSTAGGGTVTVNGTLAPGVSSTSPVMVMTSNLVLNATATYVTNFFNGTPTFVFVSGLATLGGTLQIRMDSAGVNFGQAYTVLSSAAPLSQQFATVSPPTGAYSTSVIYNTSNVQVSFAPNLTGFASSGNANQQATAAAIQAGLIGAGKPGAFQPLFNLDQASYLAALSQLSGETATGAAPTNFKAMDQFMNAMLNPFLDQRLAGLLGPSIAYAPDIRIPPAAQQAFASLQRPGASPRDERFNVWATGYGGWGKTNGDTSTGSSTIDSRVGGGLAGVDYRPVPGLVLGAAAGGALTNYSLGSGSGNSNVAQLGVYGAVRLDKAYFSAAFAYGWHAVDTNRTVSIAGSDRISAAFDAYSLNTRAEVGIRQGWREIGFTPFIAAQLQQFHAPAYQEQANGTGAPFAVSYQQNTTNAIRSELGMWFDAQPKSSSGLPISLRARVAWAHNFGDTPTATGAFVSIPSGPFVVTGAKQGDDVLLASAAAEWAIQRGTWLTARLDTELSRNSSSYSGMGGIRFAW
jgi:outer membrane autotransporter protein